MRHLKAGRKFNRSSTHRLAMWRNMTTSLIVHERIQTTDEKAKELRRHVEKMVTIAKRARLLGDGASDRQVAARQLHLRRQALSFIRDEDAVKKLFDDLAPRYADRSGGYTRIIKIGSRPGDQARISFIELLSAEEQPAEKKPAKKKAKPRAKAKPKAAKAAAPAEEPAGAPEPAVAEPPPAEEKPAGEKAAE
jgi:large subunit ribosomal protein L17